MYKQNTTEQEQQEAIETLQSLLDSGLFRSRNELAKILDVTPMSISNWVNRKNKISYAGIMMLRQIKRQVDETGTYTPPAPASPAIAGRDIYAGGMQTVNNATPAEMWKDYQGRVIKARLSSDLPLELQTKVISIVVNA